MATEIYIVEFHCRHDGQVAKATFQLEQRGPSKIMLWVGRRKKTLVGKQNVKPCVTHVRYLLDHHFPSKRKSTKPRVDDGLRARVIESTFVNVRTGRTFRVVK